MITKITYESAEQRDGVWWTAATLTDDAGTVTRYAYVFPTDTLEWRSAEYGIDPTDIDTLLDMVVVEPYLTPQDWAAGTHLYDAPDINTARADHLQRCAQAKLRYRMGTRPAAGQPSPLDPIRTNHGIDLEVVALKAEYVRRGRAAAAAQRQAKPVDRVQEWCNRLVPDPTVQPHNPKRETH